MLRLLDYKVNKISKILIKTLNALNQWNRLNQMFKTFRHQEQMILSSSLYEKTYLRGSLEGVIEAIQVSSL